MNIPKRFSVAVAIPRDGSEPLCLGISTQQSRLLPLLDQCDPIEVAVCGIIKDVAFTTKRTLTVQQEVEVPVAPAEDKTPAPEGPGGKVTLEDFSDEELAGLVAPEYKVDPMGKSREELIAAIKASAGYTSPPEQEQEQ